MNHRITAPYYIPDQDKFHLTHHVEQRMAQRNLTWDDLQIVLMCGQRFYKGGRILIFLRRRDIPDSLHADDRFSRLEGTTIVVSHDKPGHIITVYRDRQGGASQIRRQSRRAHRPKERYLYH